MLHDRGHHDGSRSTQVSVPQDGEKIGRVTFGLFGDVAPRTVENFRALATGQEVGPAAAYCFHHVLCMVCCSNHPAFAGNIRVAGCIDQLRGFCYRARQQMVWCCIIRSRASIGSYQVCNLGSSCAGSLNAPVLPCAS